MNKLNLYSYKGKISIVIFFTKVLFVEIMRNYLFEIRKYIYFCVLL